jgi:hypothetical protein
MEQSDFAGLFDSITQVFGALRSVGNKNVLT